MDDAIDTDMKHPAKIFIACDFVLDPALDAVAEDMQRRGHTVVRGPAAVPGTKTVFAPADHARYFGGTDVLVITTRAVINDAILDAAGPRLRGIVFPSIGTESIDLPSATRRGLVVANGATPENFQSMAEATVMLFLNLCYDLKRSTRLLRDNAPRPPVLSAQMLRGKTIGLIGLGRVARGVAQRLQGWDVNIVACNPGTPADQVPRGVRLVCMEELLACSDLVSVHTTLNSSTVHLIGAPELAQMKPGAFLVNTARGGCVDERAVHEALAQGRIAGAALDAFEVEPLPINSPLRQLDNAILTPHMVGHTQELFRSFAPACIDNVLCILAGEVPRYVCHPR